MRLIEMSKATLYMDHDAQEKRGIIAVDKIRAIIKDISTELDSSEVPMAEAIDRCLARGYSPEQFDDAILECEDLNLFSVSKDRKTINLF